MRPNAARSPLSTGSGGRSLSQGDDEAVPLLLLWPAFEVAPDSGDDRCELGVVECPDQDQARVVARGLGPFARERREVAAVTRDEQALLGGCEFEHERVVEPFERRVGGEREDVVSRVLKRVGDAVGGEVGVQPEPHGRLRLGGEFDERVELMPLRGVAAVLCDPGGDLLGIGVAVGECEAYLPFAELRVLDESLE